jgi:hypothetical protein
MVRIETPYTFDGPDGPTRLLDLFDGQRQLIVYHFMFEPTWDEGCVSCSYFADSFTGAVVHLPAGEPRGLARRRLLHPVVPRHTRRLTSSPIDATTAGDDVRDDPRHATGRLTRRRDDDGRLAGLDRPLRNKRRATSVHNGDRRPRAQRWLPGVSRQAYTPQGLTRGEPGCTGRQKKTAPPSFT